MDGSTETVRGLSHKHGAVYQLVVETGDWPNAWILVPGGNHGDPFRPEFENFLPEWSKGKMRPVEFYRNETEARARAVRVIEFTPGEE